LALIEVLALLQHVLAKQAREPKEPQLLKPSEMPAMSP
jgi:hypothetical protein